MKIAFLTSEYPHEKTGNFGGIGTSIKNLAYGLLSQGHTVVIIIYDQKKDEIFEEQGILFYLIKNIKIKYLSWYFTRKKIEILINLLYSEEKIEIVEAPDWTGITSFIKPKKCPIVIREHGSDTYFCYLENRIVKLFNKFVEKTALINADGIISVSQFTALLTNNLFNIDSPFIVIPNGVDLNYFQRSNSKLCIEEQNILYFGSLIRKKGLLELPYIFNKVIEKFPNAKLTLVGNDAVDFQSNISTWKMMQPLFSEKAISNVHYLGSVPYNEIQSIINQSTLCVFPSFAEAMPVSWLEAMAMQKAIVASNIGWANEIIVDGKSGFLVDPQDHDKFALRIVELLENPDLIVEFGKNARKKIEQDFSNEVVATKSINFYKSLI